MELQDYKALFWQHLQEKVQVSEPENLYRPVSYILNLGGKRIRPLLTLLSTVAFGGDYKKALDAALSVEVFHNFTLLHDDIMDKAPVRRGMETVHEKWNINTGILSGDVMLINAYQYLESYEPAVFKELTRLFSQTAQEVCEGQQYDMDFEKRHDVQLEEYVEMIRLKTSVLLASALEMGAIIAGASIEERKNIYNFGIQIGLAFQLQDDYLDTFGNPDTFGKKIGGDILEQKKTWLYIKALSVAEPLDKERLSVLYHTPTEDEAIKIKRVRDFYKDYGIDTLIQEEIHAYSLRATAILERLSLESSSQRILMNLVQSLEKRQV